MSNLSELLPTGGGQNAVDFVATGNLASGQAVVLKTDGTVEAITETVVSDSVGTEATFYAGSTQRVSAVFDSSNNKVVIAYRDLGNSAYGTAIVGTVSGTSISFGTAVVYQSAAFYETNSAVFDSTNNKVVINYNYNTAIVGTVSGTSISFGTAVVFASGTSSQVSSTFDSTSNKVIFSFRWGGSAPSGNYGTAIVGTVSGTSITFGSLATFSAGYTSDTSTTYDSYNNKVVIAYKNDDNSDYGTAVVGTVSGTSISFGTAVVFESASTNNISATFDATSNKAVIAYTDQANSTYGTAIVGTVSGTAISFGTAVVYQSVSNTSYNSAAYFPEGGGIVVAFKDGTNSVSKFIQGTVSGTVISFNTAFQFSASPTNFNSIIYDSTNKNMPIAYGDDADGYGKAIVSQPGYTTTNNTSFIGITAEAISNTATGPVNVYGGIAAGAGLIPYALSAGAQSVYQVGPQIQWQAVAYDSTNNRVVVAYSDNNSTGKAAVGTVSGTTITWGTPVQFSSHNSPHIAIAYDTNAQKIIIGYKDNASAPYGGQAVVGTVSGTSISFGSPVQFAAFDMTRLTMTYDANAQKTVFAYLGQSNYTQAIVGTVSGTSISFGTAYTVLSEASGYKGITYDSTAQKVVLATQSASTTGKAAVGTVSGTSISFGTAATFVSTQISQVAVSYNAAANKTLICYRADGLSNQGKTFIATVSGTSISFGAISEFDVGGVNAVSATYDVAAQTNVISFRDEGNSNYGTSVAATITGTTATYSSPLVFYAGAIEYSASTYSTTSNRIVVVYKDTANSNQGAANSLSLSNALTIASDYYVQTDGSLSTTTSTVKAGQAISATTINLKDLT